MGTAAKSQQIHFVILDPKSGAAHEIQDGMVIGRRPSCELVIPDEQVSGRHLKFLKGHTTLSLIDLDSYNKTRVNGEIIKPNERYRLKLNDVISIGNQVLIVTTSDKVTTKKDIEELTSKLEKSESGKAITFNKDGSTTSVKAEKKNPVRVVEKEAEIPDQGEKPMDDDSLADNIVPMVSAIAEFGPSDSGIRRQEEFYHYGEEESKYNNFAQMLKELSEYRRRMTDLEMKINGFYEDLEEARGLGSTLETIKEKKDEIQGHLEGISPEPESFYRMEMAKLVKQAEKIRKQQKQYDSILSMYDELNEHRQEYKAIETKLKLIDVEETKERIRYAKDAFLQTKRKFEHTQAIYDRMMRETKKKKKVEQINKKSEIKEQLARLKQQLAAMEDDDD